MSQINLSELNIYGDIETQITFDRDAYGLSDGNGYVNVSLQMLTEQEDIDKVKPLYDTLNIEPDRNFASIKVTDGNCEPPYAPAIWSVEGKPCLRIGGYNFKILIEDNNCFVECFTSVGGSTEVAKKIPIFYEVESYKNSNGEPVKILNFSMNVVINEQSLENDDTLTSDDSVTYNFRCLLGEDVVGNAAIDKFIKTLRSGKSDKTLEALNLMLRSISFTKKVNLNKMTWLFKTPGLFERIKSLYPNGKMGLIATSANYKTDSNYGDFIELEIDFSFYCSVWGIDPIVDAQGKQCHLSEVKYLVVKANQYATNNNLKQAYVQRYQGLILFTITAPNERNIDNYPKYSAIPFSKVSPNNIAQFMSYGMNPTIEQKLEAKPSAKFRISGSNEFQDKAKDFSFQ